MDDAKKHKVARFLEDRAMADAVREVIERSFIHPRYNTDLELNIAMLAASRLAIDYLRDAWKELEKFRSEAEQEEARFRNPGI
jgi:hypothetical protein